MPFIAWDVVPSPYIRGIGTFSFVNSTIYNERNTVTHTCFLEARLPYPLQPRFMGKHCLSPPGTLSLFERGKQEAQSTWATCLKLYSYLHRAENVIPVTHEDLIKMVHNARLVSRATADPRDILWLSVCTVAFSYLVSFAGVSLTWDQEWSKSIKWKIAKINNPWIWNNFIINMLL